MALNKNEKIDLRSQLFKHLDGIVCIPIGHCLHDSGICDFILEKSKLSLKDITSKFKANEGYLNVALRALASQGWLSYSIVGDEIIVETNEKSAVAFGYFPTYKSCFELMKISGSYHKRNFELEPFQKLEEIIQAYENNFNFGDPKNDLDRLIQQQIKDHIEGHLVGPTSVILGMGGMFQKYFMSSSFKAEEYHKDPESFSRLLDFLSHLGWFEKKNDTYKFTDKGIFFAKRASAYGVTVSYIPTLRHTDHLLFGDLQNRSLHNKNLAEIHVDREMNVWGSGGAHSTYFKFIDDIIIEIFNKPIEEQPKGILDMGCGNGAFLIHLFDVIENKTLRGTLLEEHPLILIGADYNEEALKVSRKNLIHADVWAKLIWGDIGDPDRLAKDLKEDYGIALEELLNVRTFLDHNRIWEAYQAEKETMSFPIHASGAYASKGKRLNNKDVVENLKAHFTKWKPYISKYGLIFIELHTIQPEIAARNIGFTAATAYDVTHGFSDQYIVEIDVQNKVLEDMGLVNDKKLYKRFPDKDSATVSLNYVKDLNS